MAESKIKGLTKVTYNSNTAVTVSAKSVYKIDIDSIIPSGMIPLFVTSKRNGGVANSVLIGCPYYDTGWKIGILNYHSDSVSIKPYADVYCI